MGLLSDALNDEEVCAAIEARVNSTKQEFLEILFAQDSLPPCAWEERANRFIKEKLQIDALIEILMAHEELSKFSFAQAGAMQRLRSDPTQVAKAQVHECWRDWQQNPARYKSKAQFARDMQSKWPEELTSVEVIARWCRGWAEQSKTQQAE